MYIKWDNPKSSVVSKTEAELRMAGVVAAQFSSLVREINKRNLSTQKEIVDFIEEEVGRVLGIPRSVLGEEPTHGFVICCDTWDNVQKKTVTRYLVDRGRIRTSWWTEDISDALVFEHKEAAERKRDGFKHNNPRVMTYAEARGAK